ncbi:hypothetical protein RCN81_10235, partial [Escherichia coli]|nr:hypothetical protein [Escherichia coli]
MKYLAHALLLLLPASASATEHTIIKYVPDEIRQTIFVGTDGASPYLLSLHRHAVFSANQEPITRHELLTSSKTNFPVTLTKQYQFYKYGDHKPLNIDTNTPKKWEGKLTTQLGHNNTMDTTFKFGSNGAGFLNQGDFTVTNSTGHILTARCPVPEYIYANELFDYDTYNVSHSAQFTDDYGISSITVNMFCQITYRIVQALQLEIEKPVMNIGASDIEKTHENRLKSTGFGGLGVLASLTIENPNTNDVQVAFSKSDLDLVQTTVKPNRDGEWTTFYVKLKRKQPGSYQY